MDYIIKEYSQRQHMLTPVNTVKEAESNQKAIAAVTLTLKTANKSTLTHILQQAMKGSTVTIVSRSRQSKPQVIN